MSFVIFLDDHEQAHVHVFGDGEAKIEIGGDGLLPRIIYAVDMKGSVKRRARRVVAENRALLLEKWAEFHGRSD